MGPSHMIFRDLGSQLTYRIPSKHEMECTFPQVESVDAFLRLSFTYVRHQFERLTADARVENHTDDVDVMDSYILVLPEGYSLDTHVRALCFRAGQDDWSSTTYGIISSSPLSVPNRSHARTPPVVDMSS
eukprot:7313183-Pyramimonas_sp.AAC.1